MSQTTAISQDFQAEALGERAVKRGLISPEQLEQAQLERSVTVASGSRGNGILGAILVYKGFLSVLQLEELLKELRTSGDIPQEADPLPPVEPTEQGPTLGTFGKYVLLRVLGRGGMGVVYEARDISLNRAVALKVMSQRKTDDSTQAGPDTRRFVKEARFSANLPKHPNIATVFEAGVCERRRYISMELVRGLPMGRWRARGAVPVRDQVRVLRDVALGAHHAHEQGIVHRDLKPNNVLIDESGVPVITDFGVAKSMVPQEHASLTPEAFVVGSPEYMSPEQAMGRKTVDRRADVYALGVMLYEILAGRVPVEGKKPMEVLLRVVEGTIPPPSKVAEAKGRSSVDASLERVCMKALAKKESHRHATAKDFADELTAWLSGDPSGTGRPNARARSLWTAAVGAAALSALVVLIALLAPKTEPEPARPAPEADSPEPEGPLEAVFGEVTRFTGLRWVGGKGSRPGAVTHEGRTCGHLVRENGVWRLDIDLDDAWAASTPTAEVRVEYFDGPAGGRFLLLYRSPEKDPFRGRSLKGAGVAEMTGTGTWKTASFLLANPSFDNRVGKSGDFRLVSRNVDLYVHRISVHRFPAPGSEAVLAGSLPALSPPPPSPRPGLQGEYFSGIEFDERVARRVDPRVTFQWRSEGPAGLSENFSVRWTGFVRILATGPYLFETRADNSIRVRIGETPIIQVLGPRAGTTALRVCTLEAGYHKVVVEYAREAEGGGVAFSCYFEKDGRMHLLGPDAFFH